MMSDFDYSLDVGDSQEAPEEKKDQWNNSRPAPGPLYNRRSNHSQFMNTQYSEAFGDYRGGYGMGGGFGPRPRPYPGPMRGRGFGPIGQPMPRPRPPIHMSALFLEDCEVHPQFIRNLPWELLDMIEPGYCGLCSQHLESFHVASIHYNCKNHYKAQKKFMAQHKTAQTIKETPIKARTLYCELCDVHITSTAHADSHYAGKSHRAVVDGRKPPKNPILLKPGMEQRVNQLLRREKKSLKALPEVPKDDVKTALDKSVPPELVCEICKTTVTCSEQMTSHLNGKKHLTKEKHHILKMMKGDADKSNEEADDYTADADADDAYADADDAGADAVDKEETKEQQAEADHQDDWTSGGGGDWDNHQTTE